MEYYRQLTDVDYFERKAKLHVLRNEMLPGIPLKQMTKELWYLVCAKYLEKTAGEK